MITPHNLEQLLLTFPTFTDHRGSLTVADSIAAMLPFVPQRIFWIHGIPSKAQRGGHAHRTCWELLVALHGSLSVTLKSSTHERTFVLDNPAQGLLIPPGVWCTLHHFSDQSLCLCMASEPYCKEGYITEFHTS